MKEPTHASGSPRVELLPTVTHGRYLVQPPTPDGAAPLLVGFHGYGENAEIHLGHLRLIPGSARWRIAAIQALHRFYRTKTNEIVGSWMTRQDREHAIADNCAYVGAVVDKIEESPGSSTRLVYAGFSQGTAMAYRAAATTDRPCHGLIALGGDVPPEIVRDPSVVLPRVLLGRGRADGWYTEEKLDRDLATLHAKGVDVEVCRFDGGHEWGPDFLAAAGQFLDRLWPGHAGDTDRADR